MVERVGNVFPHVQVTVISLYSGWMPAFIGTSCIFDGRIDKNPNSPAGRLKGKPGRLPENYRHARVCPFKRAAYHTLRSPDRAMGSAEPIGCQVIAMLSTISVDN